jgi:hypothetical protein
VEVWPALRQADDEVTPLRDNAKLPDNLREWIDSPGERKLREDMRQLTAPRADTASATGARSQGAGSDIGAATATAAGIASAQGAASGVGTARTIASPQTAPRKRKPKRKRGRPRLLTDEQIAYGNHALSRQRPKLKQKQVYPFLRDLLNTKASNSALWRYFFSK